MIFGSQHEHNCSECPPMSKACHRLHLPLLDQHAKVKTALCVGRLSTKSSSIQLNSETVELCFMSRVSRLCSFVVCNSFVVMAGNITHGLFIKNNDAGWSLGNSLCCFYRPWVVSGHFLSLVQCLLWSCLFSFLLEISCCVGFSDVSTNHLF